MSDTPMTDAMQIEYWADDSMSIIDVFAFACDLERQLAEEKHQHQNTKIILKSMTCDNNKLASKLADMRCNAENERLAKVESEHQLAEANNQIQEMQARSDYDNGYHYGSLAGTQQLAEAVAENKRLHLWIAELSKGG